MELDERRNVMRASCLPKGKGNLFQRIKAQCVEAERQGVRLYRLSIGQPSGPALLSARIVASEAVMSEEENMHEYQDNGSPGVPDFALKFVTSQVRGNPKILVGRGELAVLPIPGIKPILGMIPKACGGINGHMINMLTMTDPGYPTPADQANYLRMIHFALPTNPKNQFRFSIEDIPADTTDLIMTNYPHNPSGQVATRTWWRELSAFCEINEIRLFNDAAYAVLAHTDSACTLTDAIGGDFPDLSWVEAFSASKVIGNGTGWRIGALIGSPDFVDDIATIKGNSDSGFFAPAAAGVLAAVNHDWQSIQRNRTVYEKRIDILVDLLEDNGMRLAVRPGAGFFTLWMTPKKAFGRTIKDAEEFNDLMINKTGIVGVPFGRYIRYAVTGPIEEWKAPIEKGFMMAEVLY